MSEKEKVTQQDVSAEAKTKPAKENKPAKAKKDKKPGIGKRIGKFFRELKSELKKVAWPSKKQVINNTGVVLAVCALSGVVLFGVDALFGLLIKLLTNSL